MHILDKSIPIENSIWQKTRVYQPDGGVFTSQSQIVTEHSVQIFVNQQLALRLVCTPVCLREMVVGRLLTEGYILSVDDIEQLYICESGHTVKVYVDKLQESGLTAEPMIEPTCCTDNRVFLTSQAEERAFFRTQAVWKPEWVFALTKAFREDSKLHKTTFGTHSCYLAVAGEVLFSSEDISRHNALDKAVGYAALHHITPSECMLFTTGRVPVDMVRKVITAGFPVLVTKAVPTKEAVETAEKYGLTLICKAWPDQFEVFCG